MCTCASALPINRCGHVPREVRRIHNWGQPLLKRHSEQVEQRSG